MYIEENKDKAILFTYDIYPRYGENVLPVKLQGLDPNKKYKVTEINLMPDRKSSLRENEKIGTGDYLIKIGINALTSSKNNSRIIEITAQ